MKRLPMLFVAVLTLAGIAFAQSPTPIVALSQQAKIFNAVTTAQTSGCLTDQGQNIWFSTYVVSGGTPTAIQYRLEYSYNSDAATCTTGTWFQMSDDATDLSQGEVAGIGSYPFVRANLLQCVGCTGGVTLTSFYTTTTATPGSPFGFYNPSQQFKKVVAINFNAGTTGITNFATIPAPYGSTYGFLLLTGSGGSATFDGNESLKLNLTFGSGANVGGLNSISLPSSALSVFAIPEPPSITSSIQVQYRNTGSAGGNFNLYYFFFPPNGMAASAQPPIFNNSETTATHAQAQISLAATRLAQVYLYSVNARCSAGTAQLTVVDGSTTLFSSGATEVGTTTFKMQWSPGLVASLAAGDTVNVNLSDCGAANVGTLDVQASIF